MIRLPSFAGISANTQTFRAHLELARLAIALKRRVLVLQAVEHAQLEGTSHTFKTFARTLQDDERRVDELEAGLTSILLRLSTVDSGTEASWRLPRNHVHARTSGRPSPGGVSPSRPERWPQCGDQPS